MNMELQRGCLALLLVLDSVFSVQVDDNYNIVKKNINSNFHDVPDIRGKNNSPKLSTPEECLRNCKDGEPPKTCHYKFTLEFYSILGGACEVCTPNSTNQITPSCQCILADGFERTLLSVNRMLPGPSIQVCENDNIVVDVLNKMEGAEVTIHWHGIHQRNTQYYDGVPMVTQCAIPQGSTFRYAFLADPVGTHFWHAHTGLQKMDGLYGSLIVRQSPKRDPHSKLYDEDLPEHVMLISDWFHEGTNEKFPGRLIAGQGQNPDSILVNGKGRFIYPDSGEETVTPLEVFTVTKGKRYRFRMINAFCSICPAQVSIEGHVMTIIATDGNAVKPTPVQTLISNAGERYDFILNANMSVGTYWIQVKGLGECSVYKIQQLAILKYVDGPESPSSQPPQYDNPLPLGMILNPLDGVCNGKRNGSLCVSDLTGLKRPPDMFKQYADKTIYLPYKFYLHTMEELFKPNEYKAFISTFDGLHVTSLIDNISYEFPSAPLTSQYGDNDPKTFCDGNNIDPSQCTDFCSCVHKIDIKNGEIVEVILVDEAQVTNLSHPFHLHGYFFYVLGSERLPQERPISLKAAIEMDRKGLLKRAYENNPPGKDTLVVPENGYIIIRFKADNPGFWFLHCHFLYHITVGMNLILQVGTNSDLPPVPPKFPTCNNFRPPVATIKLP
ncbi:unnamed protein product [Brassicogethes aeneus]|uniref:Uncharacterized protein n=1 Tax=Brassicogethes aeneus TaxID=1431903 RepID=A0A9P0FEP6_BRAAE|nr:unnamed protein product [Brassicogethes aeneus]